MKKSITMIMLVIALIFGSTSMAFAAEEENAVPITETVTENVDNKEADPVEVKEPREAEPVEAIKPAEPIKESVEEPVSHPPITEVANPENSGESNSEVSDNKKVDIKVETKEETVTENEKVTPVTTPAEVNTEKAESTAPVTSNATMEEWDSSEGEKHICPECPKEPTKPCPDNNNNNENNTNIVVEKEKGSDRIIERVVEVPKIIKVHDDYTGRDCRIVIENNPYNKIINENKPVITNTITREIIKEVPQKVVEKKVIYKKGKSSKRRSKKRTSTVNIVKNTAPKTPCKEEKKDDCCLLVLAQLKDLNAKVESQNKLIEGLNDELKALGYQIEGLQSQLDDNFNLLDEKNAEIDKLAKSSRIKDYIILALAICLAGLIGYLLGSRRKHPDNDPEKKEHYTQTIYTNKGMKARKTSDVNKDNIAKTQNHSEKTSDTDQTLIKHKNETHTNVSNENDMVDNYTEEDNGDVETDK